MSVKDKIKFIDKSRVENDFVKIKFAKRPGWFQSQSNIIVFSLLIEEDDKVNHDRIINRDNRSTNDSPVFFNLKLRIKI